VLMQTHKDLDIWKLGIGLVKNVYLLTGTFPSSEKYGLSSQMQRCAVSVPSNIAEGAARKSKNEYIQFLYISLGSLAELETQVIISKEIAYTQNNMAILSDIEILRKKMLNFITYVKENYA